MAWRVFVCALVVANLVSLATSQCDPSPLDLPPIRLTSCQDTIPIQLARDTLGLQLITTLGDCMENRYDIMQLDMGYLPEIAGGDFFEYAVLWDQLDTHCSIDVYFYNSTGYALRDLNILDQNGFSSHPLIDLGSLTYKQWYFRRFQLPPGISNAAAISLQFVCNVFTGQAAGEKIAYFKAVNFADEAGNVLKRIFDPERSLCDQTDHCSSGCEGVCQANSGCTCTDQTDYTTCTNSIVCTAAPTCGCFQGWTGVDCIEAVCTAGCSNGDCSVPDTCVCSEGWQGELCNIPICMSGCPHGESCTAPEVCECIASIPGECSDVCQPPKPSDDAYCRIIDGVPTWVQNSTLQVNGSLTVNEDVLVVGDLVLDDGATLIVDSGATITVTGCPLIDGSIVLNLNETEIEQLDSTGSFNVTVIVFSGTCQTVNDFNSIAIMHTKECTLYGGKQMNAPNRVTILVERTDLACDNLQPSDAAPLPDWAIGVLVAGIVVLAGVAIGVGIGLRNQQLKQEGERLDWHNSK